MSGVEPTSKRIPNRDKSIVLSATWTDAATIRPQTGTWNENVARLADDGSMWLLDSDRATITIPFEGKHSLFRGPPPVRRLAPRVRLCKRVAISLRVHHHLSVLDCILFVYNRYNIIPTSTVNLPGSTSAIPTSGKPESTLTPTTHQQVITYTLSQWL
ncbi:hypothetical protein DFP72DRAFT_1172996 [Ephemerocybe angulata]|uniref:Uncharacterized protein n=1 Tax=Ephemerocybe angulata TaxID=980116 RepID=A0A8H6HPQ3_9AGAR|nr:hypothetical protein DFP72DRAFT_1172996 [Tulosesus angulatus]